MAGVVSDVPCREQLPAVNRKGTDVTSVTARNPQIVRSQVEVARPADLTPENTLLILRAAGQSGHPTADALHRDQFRAQCKALEREGYAQIKHRNRDNETVFITAKGLEKSLTGAS